MGKASMKVYFATVKKVEGDKEAITPDTYNWFKDLCESKGIYLKHTYETGKTNHLHLHIIFKARSGLLLSPFHRKGYSVCIKVADDVPSLYSYLDKPDAVTRPVGKLDNRTLKPLDGNPNNDYSKDSLGYVELDSE